MVEFSDLISEFTQFRAQVDGVANQYVSSTTEIDESLLNCSKNLLLLSEQLESITALLEERDKEILMLRCQLQETTLARDCLVSLIKTEADLNRNQQNELENIAEMNLELDEENRNLISKINEKQALLKHLQDCEIDIEKHLKMKQDLMNLDQSKAEFLDLSENYNKLKIECDTHLKVIDDLKSNVASLEILPEVVETLDNENKSLILECEKKVLLINKLESQVKEKTKLIVKLSEKLDKFSERCRQLEEELKNILNDNKSLRNDNSNLSQQMGDYNRDLENAKLLITSTLQNSGICQAQEIDNEKGDLINEKNSLVAQIQEADKNLRKYQHELEFSKDQIRKLASLLSENKRHYKCELSKLSENCEKLAFDNLNKDIQIEYLKSNQSPKSRGQVNAEEQTNAKVPVQCPKQKGHSIDSSTRIVDSDLSGKNECDSNKVLIKAESKEMNKDEPKEMNKDKMEMNNEEPKGMKKEDMKGVSKDEMEKKKTEESKGMNRDKKEINNEEQKGMDKDTVEKNKEESKGMNKDKEAIKKEEMNKNGIEKNKTEESKGINRDKKEMSMGELKGANKDKQEINKDEQGINKDKHKINHDKQEINKDKQEINKDEQEINKNKQEINQNKLEINKDKQKINQHKQEINKDKQGINKEEQMNKEEERKVIATKSVGVMTDCDVKIGKTVGAEEMLRSLISRLPLTKENNSRLSSLGKKFKSIDDLRRLHGKAGQTTEQNVRDILIEVKKCYAMTIAEMQKNFKAEFEKLSVTHEVTLSKVKMQHQEKIAQLKREHKERVDKILTAHEEEIKRINNQQHLIQNVNRLNKVVRKK